jgi:hypothetical protein
LSTISSAPATWTEWEERQRQRNEPNPNKRAPVVVIENGEHIVRADLLWGFPKYKPGANWRTDLGPPVKAEKRAA